MGVLLDEYINWLETQIKITESKEILTREDYERIGELKAELKVMKGAKNE